MTVEPLSPNQVKAQQEVKIPHFVIEAFNELLTENLKGDTALIEQQDAVKRIVHRQHKYAHSQQFFASGPMPINPQAVFDNGWLNVENLFRASGWQVEYDTIARRFVFTIPF